MNQRAAPPSPGPGRYRSVVGVAVFSLLALLATAGVKSYRDLSQARAHEADLARRIAAAEARIRILREDVRRMAEDPLTLERLARENLGMVKPGDVVIVLPEEGSEPPDDGAGHPLTHEGPDEPPRRDR